MMRKAIQLANNTLVVSLPAKWAQLNNISKGAELEVDVKESMLLIRKGAAHEDKVKVAKVDITGMSVSLVWNYIGSVYRAGFNEIEVTFSDIRLRDIKTGEMKPPMEVISRITDKLIGMEIIRQSKNSCLLKEITKMDSEVYSNVLNRIYLSLINLSGDILDAMKAGDLDTLAHIHLYSETNINKLSDYCFRILNMQGLDRFSESNTRYLMTFLLEETGDAYAEIARTLCRKKKRSFDPQLVKVVEDVNALLEFNYSIFLKYRQDVLVEFHEKRNALKKRIGSLYAGLGKDAEILFLLSGVLDKLMEVNNSQVTSLPLS